jgi:RNA recognition motif-containing protein
VDLDHTAAKALRVVIPYDYQLGHLRGIAFGHFASVEAATAARSALDGVLVAGRPLRVRYARPRQPRVGGRS